MGLRASSTIGGVLCIALAIVTSWGLCAYVGLFYTQLVQVLPFLLMGKVELQILGLGSGVRSVPPIV